MFGKSQIKSWNKLESVYRHFKKTQMKDLFADDENRADKYSIQFENLLLDYSKNRIDDKEAIPTGTASVKKGIIFS